MAIKKCDGELFCTVLRPDKLCYPRYYNIRRQSISILKRYNDLKESLYSCTCFGMSFSEPSFVIFEDSEGSRIEIALFPDGDTSKCSKKVTHTINRSSILEGITSKDIVLLPSELSYDLSDIIRTMGDVKCFIVAHKLDEKKQSTELFKDCPNVHVVVLERVKDAASNALEEIIFKPMKQTAENLEQLLETNTNPNIEAEYLELLERIDAQRDSMERLLSEISGMYNRSKISVPDRPKISASLKRNVSDKVAQELYGIDLSVKSCGYRFSTLQVFVDDTSNQDINDQIREALRNNGIVKYEIVPSIGTFKPLLNVGAKCKPDPKSSSYGTVGGFATDSGNDLCALVSRHVAVHSSDGNVLLSNNQESIHARLIQETVTNEGDNVLDISAAIIQKRDAKTCDTRFRDEDGDVVLALDSSYDAKDLDNRHVHIWGASTSPGLGIITMPKIRDRDEDNTYIIVEDRHDDDEAFCKRGDSGAMVCADDIDGKGVEVISMVIGEDIEKKGKYATLRLDKGLEQLKRQTSENFNLCKD